VGVSLAWSPDARLPHIIGIATHQPKGAVSAWKNAEDRKRERGPRMGRPGRQG
jgi:hypothetical protein